MTFERWRHGAATLALVVTAFAANAGPLDAGTKRLQLHAKDGSSVEIGTVALTPRADGRTGFALRIDSTRFSDHFLSMREFAISPGSSTR